MITKKLATGWYKITTDKDVYEVENNIELQVPGWELGIRYQHNNELEKIDTCATLKEAKEVIQMIELRDNKQTTTKGNNETN